MYCHSTFVHSSVFKPSNGLGICFFALLFNCDHNCISNFKKLMVIIFPINKRVAFLAWTHKTTIPAAIIRTRKHNGFTSSIQFDKAFHQNIQSVHKVLTV